MPSPSVKASFLFVMERGRYLYPLIVFRIKKAQRMDG